MARIVRMIDTQHDRHYQRIWGGFAFPDTRAGFAVVVAEESSFDIDPVKYIIDEFESDDTGLLLEHAVEKTADCGVTDWWSCVADKAAMAFLTSWNNTRINRHLSTFAFASAPSSERGTIGYGTRIVLEKLRPEANRLAFPKESCLIGRLKELPKDRIQVAKAGDFPALAALGYVISAMDLNPYSWGQENRHRTAITDYDIFGRQ